MRFHVVSVANTQVTRAYSWHPYTQKVRRFCDMMMSLEHEVFLYAGEENEAHVTEHVACLSEAERFVLFPERWPSFDPNTDGRRLFNGAAALAICDRAEPGDVLCLIEGTANRPIVEATGLLPVEFGVGYEATFCTRRVFESYAWMHAVYGMTGGAWAGVGNFLDEVIPNSFDPAEFPAGAGGDYLLYIGRLNERKGLELVAQIARDSGCPLVVAGQGNTDLVPLTAEYVGVVGPEARAELLGGARAVLAPTLNMEPFGGAVVEAQLCGTPAITTDWGAFVETVEHGVSGFRCRDLPQFLKAVEEAPGLSRARVRERALELYSTDVVRHQYEAYFRRVAFPPPEAG
jgi:glycosyltransferase involved in cell wall biosynthesis